MGNSHIASSGRCCASRDRDEDCGQPRIADLAEHGRRGRLPGRGRITDFYIFSEKNFGKGAFAFVVSATEHTTGAERAIKTVSKALSKDKALTQEVAVMGALHHPHIVRLFETFEDHVYLYMVMEPCSGGELFEQIIKLKRFSEKNCATLMHQLLYGVNYMHTLKICHRDLKPENLLLRKPVADIGDAEIKVADLGFACAVTAGAPLRTKCGSPLYVAPEVMGTNGYNELCDLWSCGVIMFILLSGDAPFKGKTPKDVLRAVVQGSFSYHDRRWENIGDECKDFINSLLELDVNKRASAKVALQESWIIHKAPNREDVHVHESLIGNMRAFHQESRLKQVAMHIMAKQLDQSSIEDLRKSFISLDIDCDGHLSIEEFRNGLKTSKVAIPGDLQEMLKDIDTSHSGLVDYTEFIAATLDRNFLEQEQACWAAFCAFDVNKDGHISREEFAEVLQHENVQAASGEDLDAQLKDIAANKESIGFAEFMQLIRGSSNGSSSTELKS